MQSCSLSFSCLAHVWQSSRHFSLDLDFMDGLDMTCLFTLGCLNDSRRAAVLGFVLLFRIDGSALPRTLSIAIAEGGLTLVLGRTVGSAANFDNVSTARRWRRYLYPFQTFAFFVGFTLAFATILDTAWIRPLLEKLHRIPSPFVPVSQDSLTMIPNGGWLSSKSRAPEYIS